MKQCTKCKKTKDFSEFHIDKKNLDGHKNVCKQCRNKPLINEDLPPGYKECSFCKEIKKYKEFNKRSDSKDGYRNVCKECIKKAS